MATYNNSFKSSSISRPPRKWVDKSHSYNYTDGLARIVPTLVDKLQPGEEFEFRETTKLWTLPFFAPVFSAMQNKSRLFVAPMRKLVPHFEAWLTSEPSDPMLSIYTTVWDVVNSPYDVVLTNLGDSSLADYLGWPSLIRQWCIMAHHQDLEFVQGHLSEFNITPDFLGILEEMKAASDETSFTCTYCDDPFSDKPVYQEHTLQVRSFFDQKLSLVPFIAYQKIIDDWLIEQRFQPHYFDDWFDYYENEYETADIHVTNSDEFSFTALDGNSYSRNTLAYLMALRQIGYGKDYFTSCATKPQRGDDVVIGPDKLDLLFDVNLTANEKFPFVGKGSAVSTGDKGKLVLTAGYTSEFPQDDQNLREAEIGQVWAQVNESDVITPIKLRWQMAFQKFLERQNIGGYSRYTDFVMGQTGIRVPDPYLLRSVYVGGYKTPINANPVVAQSDGAAGDDSSILGEVAATGHGFGSGAPLRGRIAHDYVVIMSLSWNIAETYYYQGFRTIFTDLKVLDMPLWEFAGVGEQPVTDKELFFGETPDRIFGYQRRFSNHKIYHNEIHGEFRGNLEYFHTGRKFLQQPTLGGDFIYQRGSDGHDRVFSIDPKLAHPFRITKCIYYKHKMTL